MRATLTALVVLVVVALTLPTAAQAQLPVGSADGVRDRPGWRTRGGLHPAGNEAVASGRRPRGDGRSAPSCPILTTGPQPIGSDEFNVLRAAPRPAAAHRTPHSGERPLRGPAWRLARWERANGVGASAAERIVSIPLTQAGAVFLDERKRSLAMMGVRPPRRAAPRQPRRRGLPGPGAVRGARIHDSAAASATGGRASPAAKEHHAEGAVGYWSNGARSVAVAIVSASGRRLFIEFGEGTTWSGRTSPASSIPMTSTETFRPPPNR